MIKGENNKKQLEDQLENVNHRLEILSMIENKLLKIRELAQRVVEEDLTEEEIQNINEEVQILVEEVDLLNNEPTKFNN